MKNITLTLTATLLLFTACKYDSSSNLDYLEEVQKYSIKFLPDENYNPKSCTLVGNLYLTNSAVAISGSVKRSDALDKRDAKIEGTYNLENNEIDGELYYYFTQEENENNTSGYESVGSFTGNLYKDYGKGKWSTVNCEGTWRAEKI